MGVGDEPSDATSGEPPPWAREFPIYHHEELAVRIGGEGLWPVATSVHTPVELRQGLLACSLAYNLQVRSIDNVRKRYVGDKCPPDDLSSLGGEASEFLRASFALLERALEALRCKGEAPFGMFGAELTLFRALTSLEAGRQLANRGLLLETKAVLRSALEMVCWAHSAFPMEDEQRIKELRAEASVTAARKIQPLVGRLYGALSETVHWRFEAHRRFLLVRSPGLFLLKASSLHRAVGLAFSLLVLRSFLDLSLAMYGAGADGVRLPDQQDPLPSRDAMDAMFARVVGAVPREELLDVAPLLLTVEVQNHA